MAFAPIPLESPRGQPPNQPPVFNATYSTPVFLHNSATLQASDAPPGTTVSGTSVQSQSSRMRVLHDAAPTAQLPPVPITRNYCPLKLLEGPGMHTDDVPPGPCLLGRYRDQWTDCCVNVPLCLHSFFCPGILLGQIWEKLIGGPGKCCSISAIVILTNLIPDIGWIVSAVILVALLCQLQQVFARRYRIPLAQQPTGCQLCCCSPCTLSQMARHMEDYDNHPEKQIICNCTPTLDFPQPVSYLWAAGQAALPTALVVPPTTQHPHMEQLSTGGSQFVSNSVVSPPAYSAVPVDKTEQV